MKHAALATVLLAALAAPLAAQQPAHPDTAHAAAMGHRMPAQGMHQMAGGQQAMRGCGEMTGGMMHDSAMSGMMEGMMHAMAGSAEHVLGDKTRLRLTADQESRITALRDAARSTHDAALRDAERHQQELDQVMAAPAPDTSALKMHFDGAFAAMGQAHLAMLRSAALTRALLTDAQRRQVDSLETAMGCGGMSGRAMQPARRD